VDAFPRYTRTYSVADLKRSGVTLAAQEAIAIVQKLIHDRVSSAASPPYGPPTIENVELGQDGSVTCRACEITPAVAEAAILLQTLLPPGAPLPGGLRYALARALHEVDAPPFDSLNDFSSTLSRYERGDRTAIVRRLVRRAMAPAASRTLAHGERRRASQAIVDVRRRLRDADRARYEQQSLVGFAPKRGTQLGAVWRTSMAVAVVVAMLVGAVSVLALFSGSPATAVPQLPSVNASIQRDIQLPSERVAPPVARRTAIARTGTRDARRPAARPQSQTRGWSSIFHIKLVDDFSKRGRH